MLVKELIVQLEKTNPNFEVILSKDAEGNGYSPLSSVETNLTYLADNTWSGEVIEDHESDNCIVLWPVN